VRSYSELNYTAHFDQALRAAREGIVLLSHKRGVLPLAPNITLAVSGPNADNAANMQGIDCHGVAPFLITPIQGLGNYSRVTYPGPGCSIGKANDTAGFAAVAAAAGAADATVLVLGLDPSIEYHLRGMISTPAGNPDLTESSLRFGGLVCLLTDDDDTEQVRDAY
jgi:beta-glucosidase-like glycosyl hydrolase